MRCRREASDRLSTPQVQSVGRLGMTQELGASTLDSLVSEPAEEGSKDLTFKFLARILRLDGQPFAREYRRAPAVRSPGAS